MSLLMRVPAPADVSAGETLTEAVRFADAKAARVLLAAKVDPEDLGRALTQAAFLNRDEILGMILEAGIGRDQPDRFSAALVTAAELGAQECLELLLEAVPDLDVGAAFVAAVRRGYLDCIKRLVKAGADPARYGAAERAEKEGHILLARYFRGEDVDEAAIPTQRPYASELRGARRRQAVRRACKIVRGGALDGNCDLPFDNGYPPIALAARQGVPEVVAALLERGAEPDARVTETEYRTLGVTALHLAAERGFDDIVRLLLEAGADPNVQPGHEMPPLLRAASRGDPDVVRLLLEAGGDPTAATRNGETAHRSASGIFREQIRRLVRDAHRAARSGQDPEGVRFPPRELRRQGPGAGDFLDVLGETSAWCVVAVRAPIEEVGHVYTVLRDATRWQRDVVGENVAAAGSWVHIVQLRGKEWTVMLSGLGRWIWGNRYRTGRDGHELACLLPARAVAATFDGKKCTYEVYEDGSRLEEIRWEKDGELLFFRSRLRDEPADFGAALQRNRQAQPALRRNRQAQPDWETT